MVTTLCRDGVHRSTQHLRRAWFAGVLTVLASTPIYAQWNDVESTRSASKREALVLSEHSAELRIWLDEEHAVHMQFKLAPGLVGIAPHECVTIQVDTLAMQDLSAATHECSSAGQSAQLLLTRAQNGQINSPMLRALMNGRGVTLRYRLSHAGYGSEQFSLKRSKQALSDALGENVKIIVE